MWPLSFPNMARWNLIPRSASLTLTPIWIGIMPSDPVSYKNTHSSSSINKGYWIRSQMHCVGELRFSWPWNRLLSRLIPLWRCIAPIHILVPFGSHVSPRVSIPQLLMSIRTDFFSVDHNSTFPSVLSKCFIQDLHDCQLKDDVPDCSFKKTLIHELHVGKLRGHLGKNKTIGLVEGSY